MFSFILDINIEEKMHTKYLGENLFYYVAISHYKCFNCNLEDKENTCALCVTINNGIC